MMKNDRWLQIQEIFHGALSLKGEDRLRFLDTACREDLLLRKELDSLLQYEDDSPESIKPLMFAATKALDSFQTEEKQSVSLEAL